MFVLGLSGEERVVVLALVGLALAAGVLLWWQGRAPSLGWEGATGAAAVAGSGASGEAGQPGGATGGSGDPGSAEADSAAASAEEAPAEVLTVHVAGAVARPGVYCLPAGSRVVDAVNAAGGPTAAADPNAVNLARPLADGERFYLPTRAEVKSLGPGSVTWPGAASGQAGASGVGPSGPGDLLVSGGAGGARGKVDLNSATLAELDSLPGIGPTLAARIVQYRTENGPFASPEELLNVSGIGEKKLAEIRDLVTVR